MNAPITKTVYASEVAATIQRLRAEGYQSFDLAQTPSGSWTVSADPESRSPMTGGIRVQPPPEREPQRRRDPDEPNWTGGGTLAPR